MTKNLELRQRAGRHRERGSRRGRAGIRAGASLVVGGTALATLLAASAPALAHAAAPVVAQPALEGTWSAIVYTTVGMTPVVYEYANGTGAVLWAKEVAPNRYTFERAVISPLGVLAQPAASIFGTDYWDALDVYPVFVSEGGAPLLVFQGTRSNKTKDPYHTGCITGALGGPAVPWALQTWSLSGDCNVGDMGAAHGPATALAAAWPGGPGINYRLARSATNPATGHDQIVTLPATAAVDKLAVASDLAGNSDVWVYWGQQMSKVGPADGYYAKDLTTDGPALKAPGSTRSSTDINISAIPAFAATNTHLGLFAAYAVAPKSPAYLNCSNGQYCAVDLWRVGASPAKVVPGAQHVYADNIAISAGPEGRVWIAWVDASHETVSVVRTNEADTRFSAVTTYSTPCTGYGVIGLSGGSFQRLDVALECPTKSPNLSELVTQVLPALSIGFIPTVSNKTSNVLGVGVSDVGDPVAGATVHLGKMVAMTKSSGFATFVLPKGEAPGSYTVTATMPNYRSASGTLTVTP